MAYNSSLPFNALPMPTATPFVKGNATSCIRVSNLPKQGECMPVRRRWRGCTHSRYHFLHSY